jgi:hypothetical protein
MTKYELQNKAMQLYKETKGVRVKGVWIGGTESFTFNQLERIARQLVIRYLLISETNDSCPWMYHTRWPPAKESTDFRGFLKIQNKLGSPEFWSGLPPSATVIYPILGTTMSQH